MRATSGTDLLLADRIWLAVAMLHQEFPSREDFTTEEIRAKLRDKGLFEGMKPSSIAAHLKQHLIANLPPSSTGYRMLFQTHTGNLRLYRPGDPTDLNRRSKYMPKREEIPQSYHPILDWYEEWSRQSPSREKPNWEDDPLIKLIGSGKHIWADEHADEYVENLRREDI
jgi:hypothetical protein